ncbi:MAG: hypothetical protein ABIR33_03850 [Pyrinomonadaceae bacterium]
MTTKNKVIVCLGVVSGTISLLIFGYFALIVYINWPASPIAENIHVTSEWTDITVDPALKAKHRSQSLNLRIADFDMGSSPNVSEIKLPDGTIVRPEIEIYDEAGQRLAMRHSGFGRKYFDAVVFRPVESLAPARRYSKIRIRSDVPFTCQGIYWIDYDPK